MPDPRPASTSRTVHDVGVVGSANLDLVATADRLPGPGETVLGTSFAEHPGGKGLNQAVAAARAGARVAFVGAVGDDAAGTVLRAVLDEAGVDTAGLHVIAGTPTGRALIAVDRRGENSIVVVPGANGALSSPALPPVAVVLAQLEVPVTVVTDVLLAAHAAGRTTVLNPAPAAELSGDVLAAVDVLVPNAHELDRLGGVGPLLAAGVGTVVVTRGSAGVEVVSAGTHWHQPPFATTAVDTTGAGDAFCGVLAATLATGAELSTAVRRAAAAGALATTVAGAVPSLPTATAIDALAAPA